MPWSLYVHDEHVVLRGRGDTARGPVDRGVSLFRVVVAMWPGRRDGVPRRWYARVWFPRMSICLAGCRGAWGCWDPPMRVLRGWTHGLWKTASVEVGAQP